MINALTIKKTAMHLTTRILQVSEQITIQVIWWKRGIPSYYTQVRTAITKRWVLIIKAANILCCLSTGNRKGIQIFSQLFLIQIVIA